MHSTPSRSSHKSCRGETTAILKSISKVLWVLGRVYLERSFRSFHVLVAMPNPNASEGAETGPEKRH